MATIVCKQCENRRYVSECHSHIQYCSPECYQESRKLSVDLMKRMAFQHRGNRRAAAEYLGIPYSTFMRKLAKQGLNRLFCNRGKYERFQDA